MKHTTYIIENHEQQERANREFVGLLENIKSLSAK